MLTRISDVEKCVHSRQIQFWSGGRTRAPATQPIWENLNSLQSETQFPLFKFCFKLNIFWTTYLHPLQRKRTFWFGIHFSIQKWGLFSGLWKFENVKHSFCADLPIRAQHKASFGYATIPSHLVEPAWLWVSGFPEVGKQTESGLIPSQNGQMGSQNGNEMVQLNGGLLRPSKVIT